MGIEKEGSKGGGGHVGGFFQLFDWTAKSRKKLFSSKSDFPGTIFPMYNVSKYHICFWKLLIIYKRISFLVSH